MRWLTTAWLSVCLALTWTAPATTASSSPTGCGPTPSARVVVRSGPVVGRISRSTDTDECYTSFLGIPYAKPPVGPLRFKDPQPIDPWKENWNATQERSICVQPFNPLGGTLTKGKEDCLYINVYVPLLQKANLSRALAPVMVWIHGGAFYIGDGGSALYGPDFLIQKGVILVTFNYRLGPLGFLDMDHEDAPGNVGLKDQTLALTWVRENIEAFGGDPKKVTIFGESAGSASVQFHILSPMSRGLFRAAIAQSGSTLNPWALKVTSRANGLLLMEKMGCIGSPTGSRNSSLNGSRNMTEALACLRKVPASKLCPPLAFKTKQDIQDMAYIAFPPTVDGIFLPDHPLKLLEKGSFQKTPLLVGVNTAEGLLGLPLVRTRSGVAQWDAAVDRGALLDPDRPAPGSAARARAAAAVRRRYLGGRPLSEGNLRGFVDLFSEYMFIRGVMHEINLKSNYSNLIYLYQFGFEGMLNFGKVLFGGSDMNGTAHADDLFYLFKSNVVPITPDDDSPEVLVRERMTTMWTNFAKYGNPTPNKTDLLPVVWEQYNQKHAYYMDIQENLTLRQNLAHDALNFWKSMAECT